jgi:hypothetical protein
LDSRTEALADLERAWQVAQLAPEIGAALIGLAAALIGVIGIVLGVYLTAQRAGEQRRQELVVAAVSDSLKAAAMTAFASETRIASGRSCWPRRRRPA